MVEHEFKRLLSSLDEERMEPDPHFVASLRRTVHSVAIGETDPAMGDLSSESALPVSSIDPTDDLEEIPSMVIVEEETKDDGRATRGQIFAGAIAAAVAVLIAIGLWALLTNDDDNRLEMGTIPVEGVAGDPDATKAFTVVSEAYAAYNAGEMDLWTDARADPAEWSELAPDYYDALAAAGSSIDVSRCVSAGFGDWPDISDEGLATGYRFTCDAAENIPFYEAGELDPTAIHDWVVADGEVVASRFDEAEFDSWLQFNLAFREWMEATHPEVAAEMRFLPVTTDFPSAESMATALEYVDEFVEASPHWPRPPS